MSFAGRFFLSMSLLLVVVSGCKSSKTAAKLTGKITYKGADVTAGSVTFHREQGGIFSYPIDPDGTFSGSDLPAEDMVVTVETESANPKGLKKAAYGKGGDPSDYMKMMKDRGQVPDGPANTGQYVKIPLKYAAKETSPLKATLKKGKNDLKFDLQD